MTRSEIHIAYERRFSIRDCLFDRLQFEYTPRWTDFSFSLPPHVFRYCQCSWAITTFAIDDKREGTGRFVCFLFFPLYLKLTGNKYRIRHAHVYERKDGNVERKFDDGKLLSFSPSSFYCFQIPKCTYIHASLLNSPR